MPQREVTMASPIKSKIRREEALEYHSMGRKGKVEVIPTKPCATQRDLSLAYTPGVAEPCLEIEKNPDLVYTYTSKGNLVAVVSNGTAVLGLGDIGALAGKPVMEGKGVLFKRFADIDVFDIEVDSHDIDTVVKVVKSLEPTFGGINLEDIKAPECFIIEERLKKEMNIPVFHDDQHGTAIISGAALTNALEIAGKEVGKVRVVVSGAGASAIACTNFYLLLGVKRENVTLVDTKGVVYKGRTENMNEWKAKYAQDTKARTLAEAMEGADVLLGCSAKGLVTPKMVQSMAKDPIVFALANPDPEISYPDAIAARDDIIMATGRSDYPNQVNNVLGFPFIFRGALDVRARAINEEMKLAASHALAQLARQDVPESVSTAYGGEIFKFGRNYIIPKPFDPRVLLWVAPAVAKAAMDTEVARVRLDLSEYRDQLKRRLSRGYSVMSTIYSKAKASKRTRVIFPEGEHPKILQAAQVLHTEGICDPVLMGDGKRIRGVIKEHELEDMGDVRIIDLAEVELDRYAELLFSLRQRQGLTLALAREQVTHANMLATLMLHQGEVDGMVTGLTMGYPEAVRAPLQIIKTKDGKRAGGVYLLAFKNDFKFLADCTVNIIPTAEELAEIAVTTADLARYFDVKPRVAMLSYSNFGSAAGESPQRVRKAVEIARRMRPDLEIDGEMQADPALLPDLMRSVFPFSRLKEAANVLIFPGLNSANIAYKLLWHLGGAEVIGPVLVNMNKPVNILQMSTGVNDIVHLAAVTALRAQGEEFAY
jgi:malate dehydrogenase (oxaloacetate-decarboxylating)(NADP+)